MNNEFRFKKDNDNKNNDKRAVFLRADLYRFFTGIAYILGITTDELCEEILKKSINPETLRVSGIIGSLLALYWKRIWRKRRKRYN
ncbi:MAG: hypothetical protein ACFFC7_08920 [Candidatus Hermodarchaeota archaeon]